MESLHGKGVNIVCTDDLRRLYEDRRYEDAWALYLTDEGSDDPAWHYYGARAAWKGEDTNRLWLAKRAIDKALNLDSDGSLYARILFTGGAIKREIGDYTEVVHLYTALIRFWETRSDERMLLEAAAYHNISLARYSRMEYDESAVGARYAARLFMEWNDLSNWAKAMRNAAWAYCAMGDAEHASKCLSEIEATYTDEDGRWHQQVGRAYVALVERKYEWCVELARGVVDGAEGEVQVQGAWLIGHVCLATGDLEQAKKWADAAREAAILIIDTRCLQDAQRLYTQIRDAELQGA